MWLLEGARLALFPSRADDDDDSDDGSESGSGSAAPSTTGIDRMMLVGESSLVYAWTPEEASSTFANEEYVELTERRLNLVAPPAGDADGDVDAGVDAGAVEIEGADGEEELAAAVDASLGEILHGDGNAPAALDRPSDSASGADVEPPAPAASDAAGGKDDAVEAAPTANRGGSIAPAVRGTRKPTLSSRGVENVL